MPNTTLTTPARISPSSARLLTDTGNAAIPARAPLHPIMREELPAQRADDVDSSLPEPPIELMRNNNINNNINNNRNLTNNATDVNLSNLHPTNPFLQDLLISQYNSNNPGSEITAGPSSSNGQRFE